MVHCGLAVSNSNRVNAMSSRSIYLRDQADKCLWHADSINDAETKMELRKLAAQYVERAAAIDSAVSPSSLSMDE
jgi:hypothetical protein